MRYLFSHLTVTKVEKDGAVQDMLVKCKKNNIAGEKYSNILLNEYDILGAKLCKKVENSFIV